MKPWREEEVPAPQGGVAGDAFQALSQILDGEALSFGGGTVLAARWKHRRSLDVDLFCDTKVFGSLLAEQRQEVQKSLASLTGSDPERAWCHSYAANARINGIEVSVFPGSITIPSVHPTRLAQSGLALESSAEILFKKMSIRMSFKGKITVRDAYDVACAARFDKYALKKAAALITDWELDTLIKTIRMLPPGWVASDPQQIIEPKFNWDESELKLKLLQALLNLRGSTERKPLGRVE